ncbi:VanZ-like protein [Enterococcus faecalis 13-SD-W-01]|nr:VanZ-like protein [Enterococcus faecalis 13-SD-W-01]
MKNYSKYIVSFFISMIFSFVSIYWIAFPTLVSYSHLLNVLNRFYYTKFILWLLCTLALWLFYIQNRRKSFSPVYTYFVAGMYLLLLFAVLFTKSTAYRKVSLNVVEFLQFDAKVLREASLNIIYFIPLGMIFSLGANKKEYCILSFFTILGIETIQYLFYLGTFSLGDIFLNLIGTTVGFYLCKKILSDYS